LNDVSAVDIADPAGDRAAAPAAKLRKPLVLHCGAVADRMTPRILREADVALFTRRAAGGTNLIAMAAMACGGRSWCC
jgi:hypothetical protein